ncbi:hypothetical protein A4H97_31735 [Niastella yeongjuensis]|uniref:Uncharacterized protein n=1 Tax=Niastella yeongjuensis TaxID=354355 RepID=A0A1V9EJ43_9BACT|nr:DUF6770 family protein [Niastella yeongjuensis]OQP46147.1 hypothetical protein A4H97_31735 [Niastella yeongjuensis]SEP18028.1 hypothetical protein SAMN05660816_04628 [Niastella yeongjuensis]
MKQSLIIFLSLFSIYTVQAQTKAQTKALKEIAKDISSDVEEIRQDGSIMGFVVFTQLEKISADSFNYKLAIMDENMDEMGVIHFKDQKLYLKEVSFNDSILCVGYMKSNFIGIEFKSTKECKAAIPGAKTAVQLQFLNLSGKTINTKNFPLELEHTCNSQTSYAKAIGTAKWKFPVQIKNVSGMGFACFYGDDKKNNLVTLNTRGSVLWQKPVKEQDVESFSLYTSQKNAFLLLKKKVSYKEGGYELLGYGAADSSSFPKYVLKDKEGKSLKVLAMDNDPVTGKPYLAGYIIDSRKGNSITTPKELARGPYCGVFTVNINGPAKTDIQASFSYWGDGSQSFITRKSRIPEKKSFLILTNAYKDFEGNTVFTGSTFTRKLKTGSTISTVILAPTIFIPLLIAANGYVTARVNETVVLKQNAKSGLSIDFLESNKGPKLKGDSPYNIVDRKRIFFSTDFDSKTNYIVVDDYDEIFIYNATQNKLVRKYAHSNGDLYSAVYTDVHPAKDGHMLVSRSGYGWTTYSVEAIY